MWILFYFDDIIFSQLHILSVFIDEKVEVAKNLRSFSELCICTSFQLLRLKIDMYKILFLVDFASDLSPEWLVEIQFFKGSFACKKELIVHISAFFLIV